MEDNQEFHPAVKLLLARMESHPEEFDEVRIGLDEPTTAPDRWWRPLDRIMDWGTDEEKAAIRDSLRRIKLDAAHHIVMDELCNGDERRRKQQEEHEYERNMAQALKSQQLHSVQSALMQQQLVPQTQSSPLVGANVPSRYPTPTDMEKNGIMGALRGLLK